jgi:hypothetical protein
MQLIIPPGTITYSTKGRSAGTAIDLVWGNKVVEQTVLKCKIAEHNEHGSDHLPIETELDLHLPRAESGKEMLFNYEKTDWDALRSKIAEYMPKPINPSDENITGAEIDRYTADITNTVTQAIQEITPRKRICPFSKR